MPERPMPGKPTQDPNNLDDPEEVVAAALKLLSADDLKPSTPCPDSWTFALYVQGQVDEKTRKEINRHVAFCKECYREHRALADPEDVLREVESELQAEAAGVPAAQSVNTSAGSQAHIAAPVKSTSHQVGKLTLEVITDNDAAAVKCTGRLIFGDEAAALRACVKELLVKHKQIFIDLGGVSYMDSGGLGSLIGLHVSARMAGGTIGLASVPSRVLDFLRLSNILPHFKIFKNLHEAIGFTPGAHIRREA